MTNAMQQEQLAHLKNLRHELHQAPEISGEEAETAARIVEELAPLGADRIWTQLGGHGVAAEFASGVEGPTVMFRAELDGLPIKEISELPYRSMLEGKGHLCGHDGHMACLIGLAQMLKNRPAKGRVILLFQPAEETGAGAKAVMDDPRWPELQPDYAFAFHNVPGSPLAQIGYRSGASNCASQGLKIVLEGKSSHAAAPEDGVSPAPAMAELMRVLPQLSKGKIGDDDFALVTLTHVNLGEPAFGIAPADGELRVTLRTMTDAGMERLASEALSLVEKYACNLSVETSWHDVFLAVTNDEEATKIVSQAARLQQNNLRQLDKPLRWSEDFGRFGAAPTKSSLIYIGAGENHPQLHNPDYDFPDELITVAVGLFSEISNQILGSTKP